MLWEGLLRLSWWLGRVTVITLDWCQLGLWFDSRSVTIRWLLLGWMTVCGRVNHGSRYITNTKVNSVLHPFEVGRSSMVGVKVGHFHLSRLAGDSIWQVSVDAS